MQKFSLISFLMAAALATSAQAQPLQVSATASGKAFDGIGAVNGGGATSVLLRAYPEPQRTQILDFVFRPKFGASVSTMLVEIPGDGNSTQGSMPTHAHYRGDTNFERGYMWWVMTEAKRRNPQLAIDATGWSAPAWVGNIWSQEMADYIIDIRIGHAARLLVDSAQTVAEICYDCGFNTLSNFNRLFRRRKGCSPKEFREDYQKKKVFI